MKHKYVVIDSSKENHNSVDAKFKVQIPQGITGTTRVCVKSFSMPNSYHNIYGDLKTSKFVEFYCPTSGGDWVYEVFSFNRLRDTPKPTTSFLKYKVSSPTPRVMKSLENRMARPPSNTSGRPIPPRSSASVTTRQTTSTVSRSTAEPRTKSSVFTSTTKTNIPHGNRSDSIRGASSNRPTSSTSRQS